MASEGSPAAVETEAEASNANWYIAELEAEIEGLRARIGRLEAERDVYESNGFSRGRRRGVVSGTIDTSKPRVEALDIPPVAAQLPDD